jgi:FKBP-type peptidyl-prolyl cis-trans isomerase SlyD
MNTIQNQSVVGIEYTLKDKVGEVVDSNVGGEPLFFIQGLGTIVPGLELALNGRALGDSFDVEVKAVDGYGEYSAERRRAIPRAQVPQLADVQPGAMLQAQGPEGVSVVTVAEVNETEIVIDGNHPMAGKDLFFSIVIKEIREATSEELAHGHIHGPGGHHH